MKQTYFLTGYPGFLASSLIRQLIKDHLQKIEHIYLLVLPELKNQATREITYLTKNTNIEPNLITVISGDITEPNLAIPEDINTQLQHSLTHVFHLAAIYDLAVPKNAAFLVNVHGTRTVNEWVKTLPRLQRYIYFSTAYISGTREGKIYEHELIEGQTFKNHYEQTKYEAELFVEDLKRQVPVTIIRPGIVKGNSKTGETIKFDGLYFLLNFLDNLSFLPVIPYLGEGKPEGNFVPVDYVLEATSYLAVAPIGEGKTYHLTDPNPYTMRELNRMFSEAYLGKTPKGTISASVAKKSLANATIRKWLQVEQEAMDYFTYSSSYDCSQALEDLQGTGITCPDLKDTIQPMIEFYRKYKDDHTKHIKIR